MNRLTWKRSKSDGCSILTSQCGKYQIVQGYESSPAGDYQLNRIDWNRVLASGTQAEMKDAAEDHDRFN